jgi:triosephosphate isomerase
MAKERHYLIAGNWKMNGFKKDGKELAKAVVKHLKGAGKDDLPFDLLVCPPFTLVRGIAKAIKGSGVKLGAQDCHASEKGAHTGDISAPMEGHRLRVRHRRSIPSGALTRREGDADVPAKAEAADRRRLIPIICVGETLEAARQGPDPWRFYRRQVKGRCPRGRPQNIDVAYTVWAIGPGDGLPGTAPGSSCLDPRELVKALGEKAARRGILFGGSRIRKRQGVVWRSLSRRRPVVAQPQGRRFFGVAQGCL